MSSAPVEPSAWRVAIGYSFDAACLTGLVFVGIGLAQMYGPLAWVFAGLVLSGGGIFGARLYAAVRFPQPPDPKKKKPEGRKGLDYVDAAPDGFE